MLPEREDVNNDCNSSINAPKKNGINEIKNKLPVLPTLFLFSKRMTDIKTKYIIK
jgi:hypothetical protein